MATYSLKLFVENCGQTIADGDMVTIDSLQEVASALSDGDHRRPATTYHLATILHDWHTIVRYDPSRLSKVIDFHVILQPTCDFLSVINSNLGSILHQLLCYSMPGRVNTLMGDCLRAGNRLGM